MLRKITILSLLLAMLAPAAHAGVCATVYAKLQESYRKLVPKYQAIEPKSADAKLHGQLRLAGNSGLAAFPMGVAVGGWLIREMGMRGWYEAHQSNFTQGVGYGLLAMGVGHKMLSNSRFINHPLIMRTAALGALVLANAYYELPAIWTVGNADLGDFYSGLLAVPVAFAVDTVYDRHVRKAFRPKTDSK